MRVGRKEGEVFFLMADSRAKSSSIIAVNAFTLAEKDCEVPSPLAACTTQITPAVASSSAHQDTSIQCACISCVDLRLEESSKLKVKCPMSNCVSMSKDYWNFCSRTGQDGISHHLKTHFHCSNKYRCESCKLDFKRWGDFLRHERTTHCLHRETYPCDIPGCEYKGERAFKRKDKLACHKKSIHKCWGAPSQSHRVLKPKAK